MPKVVLSESQKEKEIILSTICKYMGAARMSKKELAKKINVSARTIYNRFERPETFILWELKSICKVLKVPMEERGLLI